MFKYICYYEINCWHGRGINHAAVMKTNVNATYFNVFVKNIKVLLEGSEHVLIDDQKCWKTLWSLTTHQYIHSITMIINNHLWYKSLLQRSKLFYGFRSQPDINDPISTRQVLRQANIRFCKELIHLLFQNSIYYIWFNFEVIQEKVF